MIIECAKAQMPKLCRMYYAGTKDEAADEAVKHNPGKDVFVAYYGDHWQAGVEIQE